MATVNRRGTTGGDWRYDVRYRVNGRPVERAFKRRRDADAFRRRLEADELEGVLVDPRGGRRRFAEVAAEWLSANPAKRPSSWARDEVAVRKHLVPRLGDERIERITTGMIQGLVNEWCHHQAPATVRRNYGVARAILRFAEQRRYLGASPCRGIHLPEKIHGEVRLVDAAGLAALADAMGQYGLMAHVGAQLGLRWGEVAGLRAGRLSEASGTVAIVEQVTRGQGGRSLLGPPKSAAGRRVLVVPERLLAALLDHIGDAGPQAFVFPSATGGPLDYANWRRRIWLPAVDAAGLAGLSFHDFRRACATYLVLDGIDPKTAQGWLGHSDARLTLELYAQATSEGSRRAADVLADRLDPQGPGRPGGRGKKC